MGFFSSDSTEVWTSLVYNFEWKLLSSLSTLCSNIGTEGQEILVATYIHALNLSKKVPS